VLIIGPVYKISAEDVRIGCTPNNKYAKRFMGHMKVLLGSCHE